MDSSTNPGTCDLNSPLSDAELISRGKNLAYEVGKDYFEELKTYLCRNCHECCKWISIQTYLKDVSPEMEFYKFYVQSRGLTMTKVKGRGIFLSIPHTCPHLIPGIGCDNYETRPASCKRYDGRIDFLLKDICKWNLLDEILKEDEDADSAQTTENNESTQVVAGATVDQHTPSE